MRAYPHPIVRFGWLALFVPPAVVFTLHTIAEPLAFDRWMPVVPLAAFLAIGWRAVIGGVEVAPSHCVVRNLFRTRKIPRHQVSGVTPETRLWSIEWVDDDGKTRFMPLSWFDDHAFPFAVRWYNTRTMESLRSTLAAAGPTTTKID